MREIIPLVSFPKSGNTWMRFILANIFKKDPNFDVTFETINNISSTSYFEDHSKMEKLLQEDTPLFIKEYYSYNKMPYYNFDKAIYIYRNGFDTMNSYWHFRNAQTPGKYKNITEFFKYYWHEFNHWGDHLDSWLNKNTLQKHKVFAIKYEDLLNSSEDVIYKCLNYLGYSVSRERISNAIALSSKDKMKKMSGSDTFMKSKDKNFHFVRSAKKGEGEKVLNDSLKEIFLSYDKNYCEMKKYNYLTDDNKWNKLERIKSISYKDYLYIYYIRFRYKLQTFYKL